jgi:hypothetical protein
VPAHLFCKHKSGLALVKLQLCLLPQQGNELLPAASIDIEVTQNEVAILQEAKLNDEYTRKQVNL